MSSTMIVPITASRRGILLLDLELVVMLLLFVTDGDARTKVVVGARKKVVVDILNVVFLFVVSEVCCFVISDFMETVQTVGNKSRTANTQCATRTQTRKIIIAEP